MVPKIEQIRRIDLKAAIKIKSSNPKGL